MQGAPSLMQVSPHLHPKYPQPLAASTAAKQKQEKAARVKIDLMVNELHFTASIAVSVIPTLLVDPMVGN